MGEHTLGNAGYTITGSGGGGSDGQYVFASLTELDDIITQWTTIRDGIYSDGRELAQAAFHDLAPASDIMSSQHSDALIESTSQARLHNKALLDYAEQYIAKLNATRTKYSSDDETIATDLGKINES